MCYSLIQTTSAAQPSLSAAGERALNGFGEQAARTDRDQLIYNEKVGQRGRAYELLSRLLFRLPDTYAETLENKLWRDGTVNSVTWSQFWSNLQWEWKTCLVVVSVIKIISPSTTLIHLCRALFF